MAAPPLVKVAEIQGRGRALVASRDIKPGEIILSDSPLLLYPASSASSTSSCSRCFRTLRSVPVPCPTCCSPGGGGGGGRGGALFCSPQCLSQAQASSSHSPWACHALSRLRSLPTPLDPDLLSQAHFLIIAYSLSATADFPRLLSLQGTDLAAAAEASALHSLLSSLSLHPPGFSPELTAALLAKDKMNAFGLMEPFREEDCGQRTVRAYGIYPNASFFNHDCLPNACRFDYIDADTGCNTDILVRAIHDIPAGREVCLSYFPVNWRYAERQRRLLEGYGFRCACDRCEVEKNWKDDEEDGEGMGEGEEDEGDDDDGMEDDNSGAGEDGDGDGDFPHAYFFLRYQCDRERCGGTLAPLPPSPQGKLSEVMECNACGQLRKAEDINAENAEDEDGEMLDE